MPKCHGTPGTPRDDGPVINYALIIGKSFYHFPTHNGKTDIEWSIDYSIANNSNCFGMYIFIYVRIIPSTYVLHGI